MNDTDTLLEYLKIIDQNVSRMSLRLAGTTLIGDGGTFLSSSTVMECLQAIRTSTHACRDLVKRMKETEQCE